MIGGFHARKESIYLQPGYICLFSHTRDLGKRKSNNNNVYHIFSLPHSVPAQSPSSSSRMVLLRSESFPWRGGRRGPPHRAAGGKFPRRTLWTSRTGNVGITSECNTFIGPDPSRYCALVGWDHGVAKPGLLCHKDTAEGTQNSLLRAIYIFRCVLMVLGWLPSTERIKIDSVPLIILSSLDWEMELTW